MKTEETKTTIDWKTLALIDRAAEINEKLGETAHDNIVEALNAEATAIARETVRFTKTDTHRFDEKIDRILTHRFWAFPIMFILLTIVFWVTIQGANYPSQKIASLLFALEDQLELLFNFFSAPWWLTGFMIHGVYRGLAWVISVMLPPMAIFFPLFTLYANGGLSKNCSLLG